MMRSSSAAPTAETSERRRSQEHDSEQKPLAPEAIAERRCERRDRGRRQQAHEPGDSDRRGSAVVVREHAEGDEVRPFGRNRRAPGQLGTANVGVLSRDAKGGERLAETGHEESQPDDGTGRGTYSDARSTRYAPPPIAEESSCPAVVQSRVLL